MAERLTITIDGDSSGLNKALKSAETRLNTFNTRVTNSSRNLTRLMASMQSTNSAFNGMAQAANAATANLNRAASAAARFATQTQNIRQGSTQARASVGGLNMSFRSLILTIYSVRTLMFTGQALFGGVVGKVLEVNAAYEKQQILLQNLSKAQTEAGRKQQARADTAFIWKMADKAPFDIEALQDTFIKFKVNGLDPTNGSMKTLLDTVAAFGGTSNNLKLATLGISQMASKGVVSMQELRQQLGEQVPTAIRAMATGLGYLSGVNDQNTTKLRKFFKAVEKGSVDSAKAIPAMMKVLEAEYGGSSEKMMNTWDGQMARMQSAYKRMILRITETGGTNSLFETIKKQVGDFTAFLNSAKGDEFINELQDSLSKLVIMFSKTIKFVWEYKDSIINLGKAMVGLFVINKVGGIVLTLIGSFNALRNVQNGLALVTLLFGQRTAAAAQGLGIFNAALQISRARLLAFLIPLGLISVAVVAGIASWYLYKKATDVSGQATVTAANHLSEAERAHQELKKAIDATVVSNEKERREAIEDMKVRRASIQSILAEAHARVIGARASATMAIEDAKVKRNQTAAPAAALWRNPITRGVIKGNSVAGMIGYGVNAAMAPILNQRTDKAANDAVATSNKEVAALQSRLDALKETDAALDRYNSMGDLSVPKFTDSGGDGKKKKDPLGDLDGSRSSLLSLRRQAMQLDYEKQGKSDYYNDHAEELDKNLEAEVNSIKSQKELNDQITHYRAMLPGLRAELRAYNENQKELAKAQEQLTRLEEVAVDQDLQATDALGQLSDSYNSVGNQVQRYKGKLIDKNKEALKGGEPGSKEAYNKLQAEMEIDKASAKYRTELMANEAKSAKEKADAIEESLMTEDQIREKNFQLEVSRIEALIIENQKLGTIEGTETAKQFDRYQKLLYQRNQIDKNPLAKWAMDQRDIQASMGSSLTGSLDGFIDQLAEGKLAFKDFAKSLLTDLAKVILRALIAKAILGALGLGGASGVNTGGAGFNTGGFDFASVALNHNGGMAGEGGLSKNVDPSMFAFAERYHNGGFPGLEPNEVPIIAEKGEGVFTKDQMKALGGSGGSGAMPETTVNIINQTGVQADATASQPRFDGEKYVIDIVMKNMHKAGPLRDSMKGMK